MTMNAAAGSHDDYEVMARTIDMALSRLDDATKAERWQWAEVGLVDKR